MAIMTDAQIAALTEHDLAKMTPEERWALIPAAAPSTQVLSMQVVRTSMGGSYPYNAFITNAAGTQFHLAGNELLSNSNITWLEGYIILAGQPFPADPTFRFNPVNKLDNGVLFPSGHDIIVAAVTHTLGFPGGQPRPINFEMGRLVGAWNADASWFNQFGGEGVTIVPVTPEDIDYTRIQQMLTDTIGAAPGNSLVTQITANHGSVRSQMRIVMEQALVYLSDPANYADPNDPDHLARKYQDNLFAFNKNAAANPLHNILHGDDQWGHDRQNELRTIIHDETHKP